MAPPPLSPASPYGVELLCERPPEVRKRDLLRAIKARCPGAAPLDGKEDSSLLSFIHPDHPVRFREGELPAQTFVSPTDKPFEVTEALEAAAEQSWGFPGAREALARCRGVLMVTDLMSSTLEYRERLALFQNVLAGVLEVVPALAVHWQPSQKLVEPGRFLDAHREGGAALFFAGAVNVRLFNISNEPGDMLMDTMGLARLGLPDLQCHFRGLDPNQVARVLYDTSYYVFGQGDVIADGHTVAGASPESRWLCRHESALVGPERMVLDLNPGQLFAAGNRGGSGS
jgi:hypothetical protein